jgi:hypothetical protein
MLQPDVRSAARSVFVGCRNSGVDYSIILRDEAVGCVGASGSDFARNSLGESIPLLSRFNSPVIRLLFGCYSAVIPLLIPLLFRCYSAVGVDNSSRKSLKQRTFSRRFSQKTAASDFFSPLTVEFGFPADPESVRGEPPRAGCREACSKNTHRLAAAMRRA